MKKLLIFLTIFLVGYCTFKPSDIDSESETERKLRIENARANLIKSSGQYVNDGETRVGFQNNGISVWQLTSLIVNKYDQDKDGILSVSEDSFLRTEAKNHKPGESVTKTESRGLLFTDADKVGEANGKLTIEELLAYIVTFDEDRDGEITSGKSIFGSIFGKDSEWEIFERNYGERIKYAGK